MCAFIIKHTWIKIMSDTLSSSNITAELEAVNCFSQLFGHSIPINRYIAPDFSSGPSWAGIIGSATHWWGSEKFLCFLPLSFSHTNILNPLSVSKSVLGQSVSVCILNLALISIIGIKYWTRLASLLSVFRHTDTRKYMQVSYFTKKHLKNNYIQGWGWS